jgi:2-dehydro-3-deoxyphosphogluconate aldolase / (4S)-4-hydroxy-2-oxoglutarate aldolase
MHARSSETVARLIDIGIIPIFRTSSDTAAVAVAEALVKGSIPVLELPLSVPGALGVIEKIADRFGDGLLLGAGTVLTPQSVEDAVKAGARYIVAPNTNPAIIDECKKAGVPVFSGALTPTEIATAMAAGADAIKVFPCNAVGGPDYIRSLLAPFPGAVLFPCGGVSAKNAAAYFAAGARALFTGTQLVDRETLNSGRYNDITQKALNLSAIAAASRKKAA